MRVNLNKLWLVLFLLISTIAIGQTPAVKSIRFKPQDIPISNPTNGEVYYADVTKEYFYWNGTAWIPFGASPVTITNTSELINDGDDGSNPFITLNDLYGGNAIIDGGAGVEYLQALDYRVWGRAFIIDNVVYNTQADYVEGVVTLSDAHPTLDRFDAFIINSDTKATGNVTLTGGGSGAVLGITVNGVQIMDASVPFNTDLATTAIDVVTSINTEISTPDYIATNTGTSITIIATEKGVIPNTYVVTPSTTTITTSSNNMLGGNDTAHSVGVITGIPSATPVKPVVNPETQVEVSFRLIQAGEINAPPDEFITDVIYDENLGSPDEWDLVVFHPTVDPASTDEFTSGSVSLKQPASSGGTFNLNWTTLTNPIEFNTNGYLYMDVKYTGAGGPNQTFTIAIGEQDFSAVSDVIIIDAIDTYGLYFNDTDWQTLAIPLSYFTYANPTFSRLYVSTYYNPIVYIDNIRVQLNTNNTINNTWLALNDTYAPSYTGRARYFSMVNDAETGLDLQIPNTSDLTNDGEDGLNPFITYNNIYGGNAIINGGVIYIPPNMDYYVWSTGFIIDNQTYLQNVNGTVTLGDAHPVNPRIDVFVINSDTKAIGSVSLDSGASGSVTSITVNSVELLSGAVNFNTDLATTAIYVANNINSTITVPNYNAKAIGGTVYLEATEMGIIPNGYVVNSTATTIVTTDNNMAGGIDATPSVSVITGYAEPSPVKPDVNLNSQVEVSFKIIQAGEVGNPPNFVTVTIYDENLGTPTEWDNATLLGGGNLDYLTSPYSLTKSIFVPATTSGFVRFNAGDPFPNNDNPSNVVYFALKTTADWTTSSRLRVKLGSGGNSSTVNLTRNSIINFGFNHTQHDVWQLVTIPIANYSHHFDPVFFIEFEFVQTPIMGLDFINAQFDNTVSTNATYLGLADTDNVYTGFAGQVPIVNGTEDALEFGNLPASAITVNAAGFSQNLSVADIDVQTALTTIDQLVITGGPFETIDEGNGNGIVRTGRDPANYGNVGLNALDVSISDGVSTTRGATGQFSTAHGLNNIASGYSAYSRGFQNTSSGIYSYSNGYNNTATNYLSWAYGWQNTVPSPYAMTFGVYNNVQDYYSGAVGLGLDVQSPHAFHVGTGNTIYSNTTINDPTTRLFVVGNGGVAAGTPNTVSSRSDAMIVYWDGRVVAPSFSIAEIDAEATGKALVTKEWVNAGVTAGPATYVVAASNAPTIIKDRADYVCDGTSDEVEIEAALALGNVELTEGTFDIATTVDIPSNRMLKGQGKQTIVTSSTMDGDYETTPSTTNTMFANTSGSNIVLKDFRVDGGPNTASYGFLLTTVGSGTYNTAVHGIDFENMFFEDFSSTAIKLIDCHNVKITESEFLNCNQDGITLTRSTGENRTSHVLISNNTFSGGLAGVFISYAQDIQIVDNIFTGQTEYHMQFDYPRRVLVDGNFCRFTNGTGGIDGIAANGETSSTDLTISNNYVEGSNINGIFVAFVQNATIANNTVVNAGEEGIYAEDSGGMTIHNNNVSDCGRSANNTYAGISAVNLHGGKVTGNTVRRGVAANRQSYGLEVYASSTDYTLIEGNDLYDSGVTAGFFRGSTTGALRMRNNIANDGSWLGDHFYYTNDLTPTQITADQNNYNPTGLIDAAVLRLSTDASRTITGLAGGTDGRVLIIYNIGNNDIVFTAQDVLSTDINRFIDGFTLTASKSAVLQYDSVVSRWRAAAGTGLGSDTTTASNGLTEVGNDVQLGGNLTSNVSIVNGTNNLFLSGTSAGTVFTTTTGTAVSVIAGAAPQHAMTIQQTGTNDFQYPLRITKSGTTDNNSSVLLTLYDDKATPFEGSATTIKFQSDSDTGFASDTGELGFVISDYTNGTIDGDFVVRPTVDSGTDEKLRLKGLTGQLQLNYYGGGGITGTPTYNLQVDSSGNIIEGALSGGSVSFGADNQIPFTNATTDDFDYNASFTYDGTQFQVGTGTDYTRITNDIVSLYGSDKSHFLRVENDIDDASASVYPDLLTVLQSSKGVVALSTVNSIPEIYYSNAGGTNTLYLQSSDINSTDKTQTFQDRTGTIALNKEVSASTGTSYNLTLFDADNIVTLNNAGAVTVTIPANASVAFPVGTEIVLINLGAGTVTVGITSDTLNQNVGGLTLAQYDKRTITKVASTSWVLGY